jgi:hypothetical protein
MKYGKAGQPCGTLSIAHAQSSFIFSLMNMKYEVHGIKRTRIELSDVEPWPFKNLIEFKTQGTDPLHRDGRNDWLSWNVLKT